MTTKTIEALATIKAALAVLDNVEREELKAIERALFDHGVTALTLLEGDLNGQERAPEVVAEFERMTGAAA